MKRISYFLIFILANSPFALADEIRVGVPEIYPFRISSELGSQVEWWKEVSKRSKTDIKIYAFPLERLRSSLASNTINMAIYGPSKTKQDDVIDIAPHESFSFVVYKGEAQVKNLEDLEGSSVGVIIGASGIDDLSKKYSFRISRTVSYDSLIRLFLSNRVDAMYGIQSIIEFYHQKIAGEKLALPAPIQIQKITNTVRSSRTFHRDHPETIFLIKKIAQELSDQQWKPKLLSLQPK